MSIRSDSPTFPTYLQTCKMSKTRKLNRLIWHPQRYHHRMSGSRPRSEQGRCLFLSKGTERGRGNCILRLLGQKEIIQKRAYLKSRFEKWFFSGGRFAPNGTLTPIILWRNTIPTKSPTSWNSSNKTNSETSSEKQFRKPVHRTGLINKFSNPLDPFNNPKQYQPANPK